MVIYYNNGKKERLIKNVINIEIIDAEHLLTILLKNGRELYISLDNIESIYDEKLIEEVKP